MANIFLLKRSSTASAVPAAASLQPGELAVNLADAKLYTKTAGGAVIQLGGGIANALTFNNGGAGASSGVTFNGSTAVTISYNTVGAPSATGANASGTWSISISGTATTATTANALNTTNNYQINSLGVGTAASAVAGEIRATNNVTAYYASDARLKEDVEPIRGALALLGQIRGVRYNWRQDHLQKLGGEDGYFVRRNDVGVIAQEIEAVLPEIVATNAEGHLAVRYERLTALLIEAVKELSCELEQIRKERV